MVSYGSGIATIRVNRAADAALAPIVAWADAAAFAAKPKHQTMPIASTGAAMR